MTRILAALIVVFVLAAVPTWAISKDSLLQGDLGVLALHAEATWDGSLWLYEYTLTCQSIDSRIAHVFSLDNPNMSAYINASNDSGFIDPSWPDLTIPEWRNITTGLVQGQTAKFSFQSAYEPVDNVFAMVVNGGTAAWGETLGMSNRTNDNPVVPEPGAMMLAAVGLATVSGLRRQLSRMKN